MKEIGEELREKREGMGLSLEEAAGDINYKASQLQAIEEGNFKDFKDKFLLKTIIVDYAKYLGLETEDIIDEFNDFVFESTSKIPLNEIAKASKKLEKMDSNKIASPYTNTETNRKSYLKYIIIGLLAILFVCASIFVINMIVDSRNSNNNFDVGYIERVNL
ncbi:MAG: helix-turn-helix domain-containing protein [Bacilli bacterium]|nr:helix-turn-helix domain-containing protein [Bacilli bacterium]